MCCLMVVVMMIEEIGGGCCEGAAPGCSVGEGGIFGHKGS